MSQVTFSPPFTAASNIAHDLREQGYAVLAPADVARWIGCEVLDLMALNSDWTTLPADDFLRDGGRYRRRRHACFVVHGGQVQQVPHRAHWQPVEYNALHGGMERWFAPMEPATIAKPVWQRLVTALTGVCDAVFLHSAHVPSHAPGQAPGPTPSQAAASAASAASALTSSGSRSSDLCPSDSCSGDASGSFTAAPASAAQATWFVEAHQFRIDTTDGIGRPTPEGAHRDGVDLVAVFLIGREGVKGGETRVFEASGPNGQRFTLTQPWSLLLLDDARMIHESTPIQPLTECGHRDTLVVTCRRHSFQGAHAAAAVQASLLVDG